MILQIQAKLAVIILSLVTAAQSALSDEPSQSSAKLSSDRSPQRWLLLCCGLGGDQQHSERLTEACKKIVTHCGPALGIEPERLRVLAGDEDMVQAMQETKVKVGQCTQENIQLGIQWLASNASHQDEVWIILLGHAHLYGNHSQFNIQGRDIDQFKFAEFCSALKQDRQVFMLSMPVSGFWIKPLAKPNRVIMTATEAGLEFTGTEMPYAIADVLAGAAEHQILEDIDADGKISLLDFYLAVNLDIEGRFRSVERLQTEHAQLDDNGDGKGSEVQTAYLPVVSTDKTVTKPEVPAPISAQSLDGFLSRQILLTGT